MVDRSLGDTGRWWRSGGVRARRGGQAAVETVLKGRSCICLLWRSWRLLSIGCEKFVYGGGRSFRVGGAKVNQSFKLMFVGFHLTGVNQGAEWVNETAVSNLPSVNIILMNQTWKYHKLVFIVEETRAMQIHHPYISLLGSESLITCRWRRWWWASSWRWRRGRWRPSGGWWSSLSEREKIFINLFWHNMN